MIHISCASFHEETSINVYSPQTRQWQTKEIILTKSSMVNKQVYWDYKQKHRWRKGRAHNSMGDSDISLYPWRSLYKFQTVLFECVAPSTSQIVWEHLVNLISFMNLLRLAVLLQPLGRNIPQQCPQPLNILSSFHFLSWQLQVQGRFGDQEKEYRFQNSNIQEL